VSALFDLLDDLGAEGLKIAWIPRCDNALVDDDFRILPMCAGVDEVNFDRLEGGHPTAFRDTGLDEQPRRVTNGRDDLVRVEDVLDEFQRLRLDAPQVRIDLAAR
jgi:hypothetical protein